MDDVPKNLIFSTPFLKTLNFFLLNPDKEMTDTEIYKADIGVGRSAINLALRTLANVGWIERKKRGKTAINRLQQTGPIIIQMKILCSMSMLDPIIRKCKPFSHTNPLWQRPFQKALFYGKKYKIPIPGMS